MATNSEAAALRARRKQQAAATATPPVPTTPVTVGADEPARHYGILGDPREPSFFAGGPGSLNSPRDVAEASGFSQPRSDTDDFAVAVCDVYESVLPKGCTTPTSRMRWAKGHHVPIEVYRAWEASQETVTILAEGEPAPVAEVVIPTAT